MMLMNAMVKGFDFLPPSFVLAKILMIKQHFKSHQKTLLKKTKAKLKQYFAVDYNSLTFSVTVLGWQLYKNVVIQADALFEDFDEKRKKVQ
jgi:hypothetical protein